MYLYFLDAGRELANVPVVKRCIQFEWENGFTSRSQWAGRRGNKQVVAECLLVESVCEGQQ
jgi:hypothetical protein